MDEAMRVEREKLVGFSYYLQVALFSGMNGRTCDTLGRYDLDPRPSMRELQLWLNNRVQEIDEAGYKSD